MASSLSCADCCSVEEADNLFATETGLLVVRLCQKWKSSIPWFAIPTGCYALVTRNGTDLDYVDENGKSPIWPAGLHFPYGPCIQVSSLVTKRATLLKFSINGCKTKDNKKVNVDTKLTFRIMGDENLGEDPNLVRKFVHKVKPSELQRQLCCAQEEVVRDILVRVNIDETYDLCNRKKLWIEEETKEEITMNDDTFPDITEDIRLHMNKQFIQQGVKIESITIRTSHLPSDIQSKMKDETFIASANEEKSIDNEVDVQKSRLDIDVKTLCQLVHEEKKYEMQTGLEEISNEKVKLSQAKYESRRAEAGVLEMRRIKISNLKAQTALEVQHIIDRQQEDVEKIRADFAIIVAEKLAKAQFESQLVAAKANDTAVQTIVKVMKIMSTTEGKIAPLLQKENEFHILMKKKYLIGLLLDSEDVTPREALSPVSVAAVDNFLSEVSTSEIDRRNLLTELGMENFFPRQEHLNRSS